MALDPRFIGCIRIQPALNDAEQDFLADLLDSGRTLRGTPTGRGVAEVPFAHLGYYQEHLPTATVRPIDGSEHSFVAGLSTLVEDIKSLPR